MNRVFYLFRHGETNWNIDRRCQGHTDIPLNDTGIRQAIELSEHLKSVPLQKIFSSDLSRASDTGQTISRALSIPIQFDSRLREMSYGDAEGMLFQNAIEAFGEETWKKLMSFKKDNDLVSFPGGETRKAARERFLQMIEEILITTDYTHIGISTHGGALRNIIHHFLPEDHPLLPIPNCVVYKLEYDGQTKQFVASATPLFN